MNRLILFTVFCLMSFTSIILPITVGAPGTGPGGSDPDFSTLREACAYLDSIHWTDEYTTAALIITSDITEPAGVKLSFPYAPWTGQLYFSIGAAEGVDPVITFTDSGDTSVTQYGWYISTASAHTRLRGLTIQGDSSSAKNIIPVYFNGGDGIYTAAFIDSCNFIYNSKFADSTVLSCALLLEGIDTYLSDSYINADAPGAPYTTGIYAQLSDGGISNCKVKAKKTGISFRGGNYGELYQNEVTMNQDLANVNITGIFVFDFIRANVYQNKVFLSKNNFSTASGAVGIKALSLALLTNNMVTGFYLDDISEKGSSELIGIEAFANEWAIAFNTIKMNDICVTCDGDNPGYYGLKISNTYYPVKNNIILNEENDTPSFCIYAPEGKIKSDYNNLKTTGNVSYIGYYNSIPAVTLNDWQAITGQDSNSVSVEVYFVSETDLHLTDSSIGDSRLAGVPDSEVKFDIDGELRSTQYPYMGADEADVPLTARVISSVTDNYLPGKYELAQNYPNPFNPVTKIVYNLPNNAHVKLEVISITGEVVKVLVDENKSAGSYTSYFTANNYASGTYIYRLTAGDNVVSRKMMLIK